MTESTTETTVITTESTTLEKIDEFPNPSEEEYYVAMALNVKALGGKDDERSMRYSLFGDKYVKEVIEDGKDEGQDTVTEVARSNA